MNSAFFDGEEVLQTQSESPPEYHASDATHIQQGQSDFSNLDDEIYDILNDGSMNTVEDVFFTIYFNFDNSHFDMPGDSITESLQVILDSDPNIDFSPSALGEEFNPWHHGGPDVIQLFSEDFHMDVSKDKLDIPGDSIAESLQVNLDSDPNIEFSPSTPGEEFNAWCHEDPNFQLFSEDFHMDVDNDKLDSRSNIPGHSIAESLQVNLDSDPNIDVSLSALGEEFDLCPHRDAKLFQLFSEDLHMDIDNNELDFHFDMPGDSIALSEIDMEENNQPNDGDPNFSGTTVEDDLQSFLNSSTFGEAIMEDDLNPSIFCEDLIAAMPWMVSQVDEVTRSATENASSAPSPKTDAMQESTTPSTATLPKYNQCPDCRRRKKRCPRHVSSKKVERVGPGKACSWCKMKAKKCLGGAPCARCKKHNLVCLRGNTHPTISPASPLVLATPEPLSVLTSSTLGPMHSLPILFTSDDNIVKKRMESWPMQDLEVRVIRHQSTGTPYQDGAHDRLTGQVLWVDNSRRTCRVQLLGEQLSVLESISWDHLEHVQPRKYDNVKAITGEFHGQLGELCWTNDNDGLVRFKGTSEYKFIDMVHLAKYLGK